MKAPVSPGNAARAALFLFACYFVLLQFPAVGLAHSYLRRLDGGGDSWTLWNAYRTHVPDVLFVGDSRVREDVDAAELSAALTERTGRKVTVGRLGFDSAQPATIEGILYRVAHFSPRPRLIVYGLSEYQYGPAATFDPTFDFWNMELPPDPGYYAETVKLDWNRWRLALGYLVPLFANYPLLELGSRCTEHDLARVLAARTPVKLDAAGPNAFCDAPVAMADSYMTPQVEAQVRAQYVQLWAGRGGVDESELAALRDGYSVAAGAGLRVIFMVPPIYGLESLNASAYDEFLARTHAQAAAVAAPVLDLHTEMRDQPGWWADPAHLNGAGARALAPNLAMDLAPYL